MSKGFLYDEGDELITRKEDVGGLPDTSEASAGDVLSLDSDKDPVWSAPSGGGGCLLVTASIPTESEGIPEGALVLDKTCNEILTAMTSGVYVYIVSVISGWYDFHTLLSFSTEGEVEEGYPYQFDSNNHNFVVSANGTSQAYLISRQY